jgi:predicted P-loop ATPase
VNVQDLDQMLENMPAQMRALPQWLVWRFETFDGDKKPRKVPYYTNGRKRRGEQGSDEDRQQLTAFSAACHLVAAGRFDGIGFAFLPGDGLIGIDVDNAIDPETGEVSERCLQIIQDCASYTEYSPSGRGVHIIVAGQTQTFKDNAIGVEVFCGRQFFTCTGKRWPDTVADVQPIAQDVLQALRTMVKPERAAHTPAPRPMAAQAGPQDLALRLESALLSLSPDMGHDDWVQIGMAIKASLGEGGLRLWDYWSSRGTKYPGSEYLARKWQSFRGTGVTEATVFKLAMDAGWRPPRPARPAPPAARAPAPPPAGPMDAPDLQDDAPELDEADLADDTTSTPSTGSAPGGRRKPRNNLPPALDALLLRNTEGGVADCRENVFLVLKHHPELAGLVGFDEFAHRVLKLRTTPWGSPSGEWSTDDDYSLGYWLATQLRLRVRAEATLMAGVAMAASDNKFHPVREYLDNLPAWDGIERLPFWLSECLGANETTYTRMVGPWFVMNLVRRIREPGCQADYMIVLEGKQGKRKSTSLRTLVARDEWFADTPIRIGDKDALLNLAGKWLYEIAELDSFSRAEITAVKQYLTSRIDRVREPFARRPTDRARSCCFAGTTNQDEYSKDSTGARRLWPVACDGEIKLDKLAADRDQMFAEAIANLASADPEKRRCWPTRDEEEKYLVPEQERREIGDPWYERIASWIDSRAKFNSERVDEVADMDSFTTQEILTHCLGVPIDRIDGARQMSTRVGIAMHKLGWLKQRDATGARLWRYIRPKARPGATDQNNAVGGPTSEPQAGGPAEETLDEF